MGYTDVFGGELLFPSLTSYISISTAVDVTLNWPREQQIGGANIVADFMDIDATAGGLNIDMPSASFTSTGNKATINNIGSNAFTVRDNTGGTIQSVAPGEQWVIVLRDNTTAAGLWRTFQLGASVSVASASALAGAGIKAISATLNQQIDSDVEAATPFTVVDGDRAKCLVYTAGAGTCNLPSPGAVANDWFFLLRNSGSGTLNIVPPSGLIDGGASLNMDTNDSAFIFTDGTDFFTIGFGQGNTLAFDFISLAVPGSGDFVLSGANLDRIAYQFTGVLTGNRRIVVPNTVQQYWIDNQTTGAFTLEIDTAAGAGQVITQGQSVIVYCDATDVINATSSTSVSFPVTIGQGGTGGITILAAQTNLQVPPVGRLLNTTAPLSGGGDLSADRTFVVAASAEGGSGVAELATQAETDAGADDLRIVTPLKLANFSGLLNPLIVPVTQAVPAGAGFSFQNSAVFLDVFTDVAVLNGEEYLVEAWIWLTSTTGGLEAQILYSSTSGSVLDGWEQDLGTSATPSLSSGNVAFFSFNAPLVFVNRGSGAPVSGGSFIRATLAPDVDGVINVQARQLVSDGNASDVDSTSWFRVTRVT